MILIYLPVFSVPFMEEWIFGDLYSAIQKILPSHLCVMSFFFFPVNRLYFFFLINAYELFILSSWG